MQFKENLMSTLRVQVCGSLLITAMAALGSEASAQRGPAGAGFWFGADGGYGRLALPNCASCEPAGVSFGSIRLGGRLSSRTLVGGELGIAGASSELPQTAVLMGTVSLYPLAASDAHVRLGLGFLGRDAYGNVDGMVMIALMAGAGYDVRVSPGISVVPSVSWIVGPGGYSTNVLRAGVGITFH
jgi:hypothetical protein